MKDQGTAAPKGYFHDPSSTAANVSPASNPKDYILELEELRLYLKFLLRKDFLEQLIALQELLNKSYVHKYKELYDNRAAGNEDVPPCQCGHVVKAKELFLKLQEKPIREQIAYIYHTYIKDR